MRYCAIERACFAVLLLLIPFAALAYERSMAAGWGGSVWVAAVVMAVATVDAFALAHGLAGCVNVST